MSVTRRQNHGRYNRMTTHILQWRGAVGQLINELSYIIYAIETNRVAGQLMETVHFWYFCNCLTMINYVIFFCFYSSVISDEINIYF